MENNFYNKSIIQLMIENSLKTTIYVPQLNYRNRLSLKFCYQLNRFNIFICFIYYFSKLRPLQKILNKKVKESKGLIEMHFFKGSKILESHEMNNYTKHLVSLIILITYVF